MLYTGIAGVKTVSLSPSLGDGPVPADAVAVCGCRLGKEFFGHLYCQNKVGPPVLFMLWIDVCMYERMGASLHACTYGVRT
jgi:hypothetical protein